MLKLVAFTAFALTGATLAASEAAFSAGGMRGAVSGRMAAPFAFAHRPRGGFVNASHVGFTRGAFGKARTPFIAPLTPRPFAKTTPLRRFGHFARRQHWINQNGWFFPVTSTDWGWGYGYDPGYIGYPYDPAEMIPGYASVPVADPPAPMTARTVGASYDNRDGCRAERVTVPSEEKGERTITIVRC